MVELERPFSTLRIEIRQTTLDQFSLFAGSSVLSVGGEGQEIELEKYQGLNSTICAMLKFLLLILSRAAYL